MNAKQVMEACTIGFFIAFGLSGAVTYEMACPVTSQANGPPMCTVNQSFPGFIVGEWAILATMISGALYLLLMIIPTKASPTAMNATNKAGL